MSMYLSNRFARNARPLYLTKQRNGQLNSRSSRFLLPKGRCFHSTPCVRSGDPFRQMEALMRDMDRKMRHTFDSTFGQLTPFGTPFRNPWFQSPAITVSSRESLFGTAVDVSEGNTYKLKFDCFGAQPEDINVSLKDNVLTVKIQFTKEGEGSKVIRQMEHQQTLPEGVESDKLESSLSPDGELTVFAPRTLPDGPQNIKVKRE